MKLSSLSKISAWSAVFDRLVLQKWRVRGLRQHGVLVKGSVHVIGAPDVQRIKGSIVLGDGVVLRSSGVGYHTAIFHPVRLMVDGSAEATLQIGEKTRINGAAIHASSCIKIGARCLIAANVHILDNDGHALEPVGRHLSKGESRPIDIGDDVWIGVGAMIMKGSVIGSGSVIGAAAVVSGRVPPRSVVVGNPGRVVKTLGTDEARGADPV